MSIFSIAVFTNIFSSDSSPNKAYSNGAFVILQCPSDTSVMCTDAIDPSNTGMATVSNGEMATFVDSTVMQCPNTVIRRTWFSTDNGINTDTCVQMITLITDTVTSTRGLDPIIQFSGFCAADLDSLARDLLPLTCKESILEIFTAPFGDQECGNSQYSVVWNIQDDCSGTSGSFTRLIQLIDMPPLSLTNVQIDSANIDDGKVSFEIIQCQESDLTYNWTDMENNSVSTDSILTGVRAGTYNLSIQSSVGCIDSFTFIIPQLGEIFINCPVDITLECSDDINDTNITGIAVGSAGERSFADNIIQDCPIMIVERTWFLSSGSVNLDSCVQTITVQSSLSSLPDTMQVTGVCPEPISSFVQNIDLQCSETLDSSSVTLINESCKEAVYSVSYFITDSCNDSSYVASQILEFSNIPFVTLNNINVQPDGGESSGSISYDISQCRAGELSFAWSNGSSDTTLSGLTSGSYTVTISGGMSCVDSFTFDISVLTEDITCPEDVTIGCDASLDPINLGFPLGGAQMDFSYTDSITQDCPNTIIERRWVRNISTASQDICTQLIILDPQNVRVNFQDTVIVSGICAEDLQAFVDTDLPLSCGERIITFTTLQVSSSCDEVIYSTTWFGANDCNNGQTFTESQITIFRDIPVADLNNIMITPDPSGNGGAISFDASACKNDQLSYAWSTGSSESSLDSINSGVYTVTITNEMGCEQQVDFTVPIFLSQTCPTDITIGCDESAMPSMTGEPQITGFDSIIYFDIITQNCPDRIIERRWVASISGGSLDTCLQIITQVDDNLRSNFSDTVFVAGQCSGMLDSLVSMTLPLGCNERIDFVATDPISADCNREIYRTDWLLFDECTGTRSTISQFTVFEELKVIEVSNVEISAAIGDTTGSISFDYTSCKSDTSIAFSWSNGSTNESISNVSSGTYSLTITNSSGCEEILSFDIPLSFGLTCPADIVISCSEMPDPLLTGMATLEGFDSLNYVDTVLQICPNTIIERRWTGSSMNAESVSCTQLITLSNENIRADFQDTVRISGACAVDLQSLIVLTPPLRCGESVSSQNVSSSPVDCNTQTFQVDWFILDECDNRTKLVSQVTVFEDIAVIDMTNFMIIPDQEDSSGAVTFDYTVCMGDSATFVWSNGSTMANQNNLSGGNYGLTVTSSSGCIDTFLFEVPFLFSLNCPLNISIGCAQPPTTDVTGEPTFNGYDIINVSDNITQTCPDQIIERTWTAMTADSSMSEMCTQIITIRNNISTVRENFPLQQTYSGLCTDDVLLDTESILPLACSEVVDSTSVIIVSQSCDQDVVNFTWHITDMCQDSSYTVAQAVIFNNVPVITIDSVTIIGAQGGNDGSINFDFSICGTDSVSFIWNDLSTKASLSNVPEGEYELRVTNDSGCRDTFNFVVPTDFSVVCPADITIDCTASTDTSNTGFPLTFGFMDVNYSDSIIQVCPNQIIQRTFFAASDINMDMCTQMITLMNNDNIRESFGDTLVISGQCPGDIQSLVVDQIPLSCNESVDSSTVVMTSESCENAEYAVIWVVSDACKGSTFTISQTVIFDSIPFVSLENIVIARDNGTGNGSIDFDVNFCDNNALTFSWSDGSSNKSLLGVPGGIYMVTVTNNVGCSEVFNFEVPSPLPFDSTKSITVDVVNRANQNFEGLSMRFLSNVGKEEIRADIFSEGGGRYVYVVEGELSEIGFVCPSFEDAAVRDVSSLDIVRGQRLILGISESCPEDFVAADVNFSGSPSASDLVLIRRVILGLDQNFPDDESWRFVRNEPIDINNLGTEVAGCVSISQTEIQDQSIKLKGIKLGNLECPD